MCAAVLRATVFQLPAWLGRGRSARGMLVSMSTHTSVGVGGKPLYFGKLLCSVLTASLAEAREHSLGCARESGGLGEGAQ